MPPILTDEQRRALRATDGAGPIEVVDPATNVTYVLLRADVFARLAAQADPSLTDDGDERYLLRRGLASQPRPESGLLLERGQFCLQHALLLQSEAKAARSFSTTSAGARATKAALSSCRRLPSIAAVMPASSFSLRAILRPHVDVAGQVDQDLGPRDTEPRADRGQLDGRPPATGLGIGHRGEVRIHRVLARVRSRRRSGRQSGSASWAQCSAGCESRAVRRAPAETGRTALRSSHPAAHRRPPAREQSSALGGRLRIESSGRRGVAQKLPDFLGDERHQRMQQAQQHVERVGQHSLGHRPGRRVLQAAFDHLDIKAAELVPGKIVQHPGRVAKMIAVERRGDLRRSPWPAG